MPESLAKKPSVRSWHKITIRVDARMTEAVAAYLTELTGTGLEISFQPENDQQRDVHTFPPETVTAYLPIAATGCDRQVASEKLSGLGQFLAELQYIFPYCSAPVLHTETLMAEDWVGQWKSHFTSLQITPSLTIKPSWEEAAVHADEVLVIEMDPGLAFGTGHHASTHLALLLIEDLFRNKENHPAKILDAGTGSGILAMACALLGAREVLAIDNDPDAVEAARQNVLRNGLTGAVSVSDQVISSVTAGFDLVAANITHDILAELAEHLSSLVLPRGFLVLSGILSGDQANSIKGTYTEKGLVCIRSMTEDEWAALQFQKK